MSKEILREKLQKIVESIDTIEPVADFDSDQWEIGNANIKRTDGAIGSLNVNIKSNEYGVGIDGKNKGDILDYLKDNFDFNNENGQNKRYKVMPEKIEEVVRRYAGVKKENMEQKFREYLQKYTTLVDGTINTYASALMLVKGVYEAVKNRIEFKNFYEIQDISSFLEQYSRIEDIIPNQGNTNGNGDDNGNLSGALGRYKEFLQYIDIKYWVISPNVDGENNPEKYKKIMKANQSVLMGWKRGAILGKTFCEKVKIGDLVLIAGKSNKNKEVFACGFVKSESEDKKEYQVRQLQHFTKLENSDLSFESCTCGNSDQIKAIYQLHPSNNECDKKVVDYLLNAIKKTKEDGGVMKEIRLLESKKQIILQGSPGTGKTRKAKEIAYYLITGTFLSNNKIENQVNFLDYLEKKEYKTEVQKVSFEIIELRKDYIKVKNEPGNFYEYGEELKGSESAYANVLAKIVKEGYAKNRDKNKEIFTKNKEILTKNKEREKKYSKLIQFHPAYSYEDFVRGIVATTDENGNISYEVKNKVLAEMAENAFNNHDEKFVLIIDEINRANLPAVLGELIYALEYRGEAVESMYAIDGDRKIILPENLYIIGTMNTADRSVGHIDYAIRRRFAFIDVKTDVDVIPENAKHLFKEIDKLFEKHLSEEFAKDDVMIGHSYFLNDDLKMAFEYEIKPILYEYVKDGVLTCEKDKITDLNTV